MSRQVIKFELNRENMLPWEFIDAVPMQGAADSYVEDLMCLYDIQVTLEDSAAFLRAYGAWNDSELKDLETNKARLVWLACLDCQENDTEYFYMEE